MVCCQRITWKQTVGGGAEAMREDAMTEETIPKKKGLSTLAWIGIGCGALVVIVAVAMVVIGLFVVKKAKDVAGDFKDNPEMAAARLIVKVNPELEEVSADEEAGTITVRHTKTGEIVTVSLQDLKEGRIKFTTDEGEVSVEATGDAEQGTLNVSRGDETWKLKTGVDTTAEIPEWVPVAPGAEVESPHVVESEGKLSGGFQLRSPESVDATAEFYRARLETDGFEVRVNSFAIGEGDSGAVVTGSKDEGQRSVTAMIRTDEGATRVVVSYQEGAE
jgi:hypothetical protein